VCFKGKCSNILKDSKEFRPILKKEFWIGVQSVCNFHKVADEGFLENFLCVLEDSYYLFK
jgi:hypothetical protein